MVHPKGVVPALSKTGDKDPARTLVYSPRQDTELLPYSRGASTYFLVNEKPTINVMPRTRLPAR